jgi:hypothetical protein
MRHCLAACALVTLTSIFGCAASYSLPAADWYLSATKEPADSSSEIKKRFEIESRVCTDYAARIVSPRAYAQRQAAPARAKSDLPDLEDDEWGHFEEEFDQCMVRQGWTRGSPPNKALQLPANSVFQSKFSSLLAFNFGSSAIVVGAVVRS